MKFRLTVICLYLLLTIVGLNAQSTKTPSEQNIALDASDYHQLRGGLQNCQIIFEREKKGRVAFLGGSITQNPGWRDSICAYLSQRFPETEFDFIPAGIGSMGTTSAAFRLERDVIAYGKIDLMFEEAAVNDASIGLTSIEHLRAMEGIVRHARKSNPAIDIVMMHFVDPGKMKTYRDGEEPEVITTHNKVAEHYQIPTINLAREVTDRIDNNEFTWEEDFKNIHPSPFGQGIYARSMIQFLDNAFVAQIDDDAKILSHLTVKKLDEYCYDNGYLLDVSSAKLSKSWRIDPRWNPNDGTGVRSNYVDVPMLICNGPGSKLRLKFEGKTVGIAVAAGQDAGIIEYRIDENKWQSFNLFGRSSRRLHIPRYYTLASELSQDEHLLEIRISKEKDEKSKGQACRIRYFFVNK